MTTDRTSSGNQVPYEYRKDGSVSKMRSHRGNIPVLPQTKLCPHCPAKFTRTTHLNRHLRTHSNERLHHCDACGSQFTRSDLLTRHRRSCSEINGRPRRKSCIACQASKIKCDLQDPCAKCTSRGRPCYFASSPGQEFAQVPESNSDFSLQGSESPPTSNATPSTSFTTPDTNQSLSNRSGSRILEPEDRTPPFQPAYGLSGLNLVAPSSSSPETLASDPKASRLQAPESFKTTDAIVPVRSHLSPKYSSDLFAPFFSNVFAEETLSLPRIAEDLSWEDGINLPPDGFPFKTRPVGAQSYVTSLDIPTFDPISEPSVFIPPLRPHLPLAQIQHTVDLDRNFISNPPSTELQHYLFLFFTAFLSQMPIVHAGTFHNEGKPAVLLSAMQACGALFVKTRRATNFIMNTLEDARALLIQEFAKNHTDSKDQVHLILAVVLLQTIGLFHQKADQRTSSSIYHGMLVMMIRQTGLIARNAAWTPPTNVSVETMWQQWAMHEMTKRAVLLSYLHDCCHCIYFALRPSYTPNELELYLPCEDNLWKAGTSMEWITVLQATSPYGSLYERLVGVNMPRSLTLMTESRSMVTPIVTTPFGFFVLIHAILRHLFTVCVENRLPKTPCELDDGESQIVGIQFALHNWLQSWMSSPDLPKVDNPNEEPPFIQHALPFYWLGQVSLLAYQEGLAPFEHDSPNNLLVETRFRLVKQWLKHIRDFLRKNDEGATLFWDELMKIRLQSWQLEAESEGTEDQEGLLSFFPEH